MKLSTFILLLLIFIGCDKGITPDPDVQETGFSGTISFSGEWPDSVQRTHLVIFRDPLNSAADFNVFNLSYVSNGVPFGTQTFMYSSADSAVIDITAGSYSYVAVAQSKTAELSLNRSDWYVIGVYYASGDSSNPGSLVIPENIMVNNINIHCNFNNLPPQPPGG